MQQQNAKDNVDYGSSYFMIYLIFYLCVMVHQTICIQIAHVTLTKFNPFTKLYIFAVAAVAAMAIWTAIVG